MTEKLDDNDFRLRFRYTINAEVAVAKLDVLKEIIINKYSLKAGDSIDERGFIIRKRDSTNVPASTSIPVRHEETRKMEVL